ncbi:Protein PAF1 -like protein [Capsicum chinense]|nr:Protein PAF1 -like protein [Capsicum chinense]
MSVVRVRDAVMMRNSPKNDMVDPVWDVTILRDAMGELQKEVHDLHWELTAVRVRMLREIRSEKRDLRPEYCIPQTLFSEICKSRRLGLLLRHASRGLSMRTNCKLHPVKVQPLFPDFDRYKDQFVLANFDGSPTVDSEDYNKLDKTVRDAYESQAVMKNFEATSSNADKPGKFLAYMVPAPNELSKDMYDENEDISYSKVREYHCDVRGDNADDPTTYVVAFGETEAYYMPVPSMLVLKKKGR